MTVEPENHDVEPEHPVIEQTIEFIGDDGKVVSYRVTLNPGRALQNAAEKARRNRAGRAVIAGGALVAEPAG